MIDWGRNAEPIRLGLPHFLLLLLFFFCPSPFDQIRDQSINRPSIMLTLLPSSITSLQSKLKKLLIIFFGDPIPKYLFGFVVAKISCCLPSKAGLARRRACFLRSVSLSTAAAAAAHMRAAAAAARRRRRRRPGLEQRRAAPGAPLPLPWGSFLQDFPYTKHP